MRGGRRPLTTRFDERSSTLALTGDVEERDVGALVEALVPGVLLARVLRVDLDAVSFLPSLAVGALAVAVRDARRGGRDIVLLASEGTVAQQVLRACGVEHLTGPASPAAGA